MFYLDIFKALEQHQVRYLLVGGLAVNLYGVPRMTMDVDLVIALDATNVQEFVAAVASLGMQPVLPLPLNDFLDPGKREQWVTDRNMVAFALRPPQAAGPTLDVLLVTPLNLEAAFSRAVLRDLGRTKVSLAAIEDLILMKEQCGRAQDLADIEHLRRLWREGEQP